METEAQGVTLLSEFDGKPYFKNKLRKENELITGLPDIVDKKEGKIIDIKASWNSSSFPLFKKKTTNKIVLVASTGLHVALGLRCSRGCLRAC